MRCTLVREPTYSISLSTEKSPSLNQSKEISKTTYTLRLPWKTTLALPAEFSWNDLGSWASLYEYQMESRHRADGDGNVTETKGHLAIDASSNYIYSPNKFVALVGVENLVIVETDDALLIVHRDRSQDVGKIVKELGLTGRTGTDLSCRGS